MKLNSFFLYIAQKIQVVWKCLNIFSVDKQQHLLSSRTSFQNDYYFTIFKGIGWKVTFKWICAEDFGRIYFFTIWLNTGKEIMFYTAFDSFVSYFFCDQVSLTLFGQAGSSDDLSEDPLDNVELIQDQLDFFPYLFRFQVWPRVYEEYVLYLPSSVTLTFDRKLCKINVLLTFGAHRGRGRCWYLCYLDSGIDVGYWYVSKRQIRLNIQFCT